MVAIPDLNRRVLNRLLSQVHRFMICGIAGTFIFWIWMVFKLSHVEGGEKNRLSGSILSMSKDVEPPIHAKPNANGKCPSRPLSILNDLTEEQRNPTVGRRWMVRPPNGGNLHLMCCVTTKGSFHVLLHERWAPIGVPHLLDMLAGGYFDAEIPLFRCTDACQFGLSANATLTREFGRSIPDDPPWLPTGPEHRFSSSPGEDRIERYPKGVLTHAGSGPNSRGVQFVLTLRPNKFMGGGSPWEVPLGEVVEAKNDGGRGEGRVDFDDVSLPDLYTGYGEKGPGQGLLRREGVSESVRKKWPLLDYMLHCSIVDTFIVDGK